MKDNILIDLSLELAIEIVELVKILKSKQQSVIANQICRSGTSVGANIHEARYAHSRADFIAKFEIALKEANETSYWLLILYRTKYIDEQYYKKLESLCSRIKAALVASCKTAKNNKYNSTASALCRCGFFIFRSIKTAFRSVCIEKVL